MNNQKITNANTVNLTNGGVYQIAGTNVLNSTALGDTVLSSSLQRVGTLTGLTVIGNTNISGVITATVFSGDVSGNTTTATNANNVACAFNSTDVDQYVTFVSDISGNCPIRTSYGLLYNSLNQQLTVTGKLLASFKNIGRYVELGADTTNNAYIDFHSADGRFVDFDGRILCTGGALNQSGFGEMQYNAYVHRFNGFVSINGTARVNDGQLTVYNDVVLMNSGQIKFISPAPFNLVSNQLFYLRGSVPSSSAFQYVYSSQQIGMYRISAYNISTPNWNWSENIAYANGLNYFWGGENAQGTNPDFDFRVNNNNLEIGIRNNNGNQANWQIRVEAFT